MTLNDLNYFLQKTTPHAFILKAHSLGSLRACISIFGGNCCLFFVLYFIIMFQISDFKFENFLKKIPPT